MRCSHSILFASLFSAILWPPADLAAAAARTTKPSGLASRAVHVPGKFAGTIPQIPGIRITLGETVLIPDAYDVRGTRLKDGRLILIGSMNKNDGYSVWSFDNGHSWAKGPRGPDDETVLDFGNGEILSIYPTTHKRADGKYGLAQRRSLDNWATVSEEEAIVDTPLATSMIGDDGKTQPGGLMLHHGIMPLKDGSLMATMYGTYADDRELAQGYPASMNMRKVRTVVVFSPDKGRTWDRPVTVAYDKMLARGADPDASVKTLALIPAITQEGFSEAHLVRAPNDDILCIMRTGGRLSFAEAPVFPTPMYLARTSDEGRTWTSPIQFVDRGTTPEFLTLENKIIVGAYARPNGWLIFSTDNGRTWNVSFQISTSDSNANVIAIGPNRILALYYAKGKVTGTFFTIDRTDSR